VNFSHIPKFQILGCDNHTKVVDVASFGDALKARLIVFQMRGWFSIFHEVEVGQLVKISALGKKASNR
jgi:hypothetical protein